MCICIKLLNSLPINMWVNIRIFHSVPSICIAMCLYAGDLVGCFEVRHCDVALSDLLDVFVQYCFGYSWLHLVSYEFCNYFSFFGKCHILMEISLNMWTALGRLGIQTILIYTIHEVRISLPLCV